MTLLFVDGFDHYGPSEIAQKWTSAATSGVSMDASGKRTGRACLRTTQLGVQSFGLTQAFPAADAVVLGFAFLRETVADAGVTLVSIGNTDSLTQTRLVLMPSGALRAQRGNTVLGQTGDGVIVQNAWQYLECKVRINNTTGFVVVRVDGVEVLNLTGQNTRNTGTLNVTSQIGLGGVSGTAIMTARFDDLYLCDTTGTVNQDFLGDCAIVALSPNGNGASSQWTGSDGDSVDNYALVDEQPLNATDWVQSSADNQTDTYAFEDLPSGVTAVHGVVLWANALKTDAGSRSLALVARVGSTDFVGPDLPLSTSPRFVARVLETDPSTSAAWTPSGVNGAEFGVKSRP